MKANIAQRIQITPMKKVKRKVGYGTTHSLPADEESGAEERMKRMRLEDKDARMD